MRDGRRDRGEPTTSRTPAHDNGRPPAAPPVQGEARIDPPEQRRFVAEGREWIARIAGHGAYGTGPRGLGLIEAVHFFDAERPERPLREALIAHGRFPFLFDDELAALLARATPIALPQG